MSDRRDVEQMLQELLKHAQVRDNLSDADLAQLQSALSNIQVGGNLCVGNVTQTLLNLVVSIPTSFKSTGILHNIPRGGTIKFVGRVGVLENLQQMLQQDSQVFLSAIQGMGGVGKTETAIQYAQLHLLLNTYPGGICWLQARDEDIGRQITQFAKAKLGLNLPGGSDLLHQVNFCWSNWKEGDVLLILDDVNDFQKVEPYLPPQLSQFKVLITTRLQLDLRQSLSLDVLSKSATIELLGEWIGIDKIEQELTDVEKNCQRLGYLPLALNLVGRYVLKRKLSLKEMLRRLEEKGMRHPSLNVDEKDRTRTLRIEKGVHAAFELSWNELSEAGQQLGCLLSLFALAPIPQSLVKSVDIGYESEELEDVRFELESLHLLQGEETYRLHQLIREFFQEKLNLSEKANNLKHSFIETIGNILEEPIENIIEEPKSKNEKNFSSLDLALMPHIAESALILDELLRTSDATLRKYYFSRINSRAGVLGNFTELPSFFNKFESGHRTNLELYLRAFKVYKKWLSPNHPALIQQYVNLKAIQLYLAQLGFHQIDFNLEPNFQENHSLRAIYLEKLANKDYEKASGLYEEVLSLRVDLLDNICSDTLEKIYELAEFCRIDGNHQASIKWLKIILDIKISSLGDEHPDVAEIIYKLAIIYRHHGSFEDAERFLLLALALKKKLLGDEHPDVALYLQNVVGFYKFNKHYEQSREMLSQALKLKQKLLSDADPKVLNIRQE